MVNIEELKKISIRGRVAYCICLSKSAVQKEQINSKLLSIVFDKIAHFCESDQLDIWESEISEYMPCVVLEKGIDFNTFNYADINFLLDLKRVYENCPKYIINMIDNTIEVGLANLYGGTGLYSESSLTCCLDVISIALSYNVTLLPLQNYLQYSFSDERGWGKTFSVSCW